MNQHPSVDLEGHLVVKIEQCHNGVLKRKNLFLNNVA